MPTNHVPAYAPGRNDYEGLGIGLSICRKISDRHSGRIVAENRKYQGSKFFSNLSHPA